eukprot:scaffold8.g1560.t1
MAVSLSQCGRHAACFAATQLHRSRNVSRSGAQGAQRQRHRRLQQAAAVALAAPDAAQPPAEELLQLVVRRKDEPIIEYDVQRSEELFSHRKLEVAARVAQLALYVLRFGCALATSRLDAAVQGMTEAGASRPALELQRLLERLGPCFIKLAQTLAMRADVIGDRYAAALAQLQDAVQPFDTGEAMAIVEAELGAPVGALFSGLEGPIASASLGQVYRATLAGSGRDVAVKVQRPGARATISLDVYLLRAAVGAAQRAAGVRRDLRPLVDEIGRALFQELDFRVEGANTAAFGAAHAAMPLITVPRVWAASRRVLISEWVVGRSPNQLLAASRAGDAEARRQLLVMVREGIQCSITQLLVTGVLHGDPHSGNLLMSEDGRLCYLDHGLLVHVTEQHRAAMMAALVHLGLGQWDKLVDDLGDLDLLRPDTDRLELALDLQREFNEVLLEGQAAAGGGDGGAPACDLHAQLPLLQLQTSGLSFKNLTAVLFRVAFRYKFLLPSYFPLIVRAMSSLEGVALAVDPSFKIISAGMPVVLNFMLSDRRPTSQQLLRELLLTRGGALRLDATSEQLLQVWLSSARQAASTSRADPSSLPSMAALLLDRRHTPLRRVLMEGNPALTVVGLLPRLKAQLRGLAADGLCSPQAAAAARDRSAAGRARRKRLILMFRSSVPRVLSSPPRAVLALLAFTASVLLEVLRRRLVDAWRRLRAAAAAASQRLRGRSSNGGSDLQGNVPAGTQLSLAAA